MFYLFISYMFYITQNMDFKKRLLISNQKQPSINISCQFCIFVSQNPMMKKAVFVLFLLIVVQCNYSQLHAQEPKKKSYKNNITFNITRLLLMEARFGYERQLTERHVIRTTVGIQFPLSSESFKAINTPITIPFYYTVSNGVYLGLGYNYIIKPSTNLYVSAVVYYNYSYYDEKYYKICSGMSSGSEVYLQSMQLKKSGIKFLIGKKASMSPKKETRLQFDFFAGIGLQYRQEEIIVFAKKQGECSVEGQYDYQILSPPEKTISNNWYPTLHGGILFSFPF